MNNTISLKETYELATKEPFGRLLIDLYPKTSNSLCYFLNIGQPSPKFFNLPFFKAVITTLTDEREKIRYAKPNTRVAEINFRKFLKQAPNSSIISLCECLLIVINGSVPVNKQLLKNQETSFQQ